ncbi:MAG: YdiU family protein, partial [Hydrogenophilaceae bacterium]|nr:YdiU family protein [Hydrogenophilaceae bacterium]
MLNLKFDNRFVADLPGDPEEGARRRQVHGACWSRVLPTPVAKPQLLAHSPEVAALLGIAEAEIATPEFAEVFAGNRLIEGMAPYAACYGGHQFGNWAGQLGDGRAINLGEAINAAGQRWELQLKGAGPTPYARRADGRAVLRSSIREFLCSEAMHHLGVPTTRALSLVATGESVLRDMFYDGNPQYEPGAVVCRVAPSFIRFGNFEIFSSRSDTALLEKLVDFTIARDFPEIEGDVQEKRARWYEEVCTRTARMIAHWMRVGFVHGVMNTDNMSILGLTIDYGPYGWIDNYDPDWTPNTTDAEGRRYRFGHQPQIAHWNLSRLAESLVPVFPSLDPLHHGL